MATKKGNGHDPATTAIVEALGRIEREIGGTNARLERLEDRVGGMAEDIAAVRADVAGLRNELSSLRAETRGELALHHAELALRILRLEGAVFPPTPTRAEPKRKAG